ncbi:hypothetical protein [Paenibacillus sp. sgz302251]|uniref:hypothetical protein n=1 Tax=Paenibacillus sp. sgz302251 TaxID=3414493 RepID=UPI003C7ACCFF
MPYKNGQGDFFFIEEYDALQFHKKFEKPDFTPKKIRQCDQTCDHDEILGRFTLPKNQKTPGSPGATRFVYGGAKGDRTPDLIAASDALSRSIIQDI